jgi:hypothetical protein
MLRFNIVYNINSFVILYIVQLYIWYLNVVYNKKSEAPLYCCVLVKNSKNVV